MPNPDSPLPLVYSCSGCSSAAQMANSLAVRLDREGVAEMSCIAGVGGNVAELVKVARSGRPMLVLDGCPLACAKKCLDQRGIAPDAHVVLSGFGVKRRTHVDFDVAQAETVLGEVRTLAKKLKPSAAPGKPRPSSTTPKPRDIRLKRIYEPRTTGDGRRILVERLWPRGFSRETAGVDIWLKDIAPSTELRQWFSHDPAKWLLFCRRYWAELKLNADPVALLNQKADAGTVTLVYSARDEKHNAAVALKAFLERK